MFGSKRERLSWNQFQSRLKGRFSQQQVSHNWKLYQQGLFDVNTLTVVQTDGAACIERTNPASDGPQSKQRRQNPHDSTVSQNPGSSSNVNTDAACQTDTGDASSTNVACDCKSIQNLEVPRTSAACSTGAQGRIGPGVQNTKKTKKQHSEPNKRMVWNEFQSKAKYLKWSQAEMSRRYSMYKDTGQLPAEFESIIAQPRPPMLQPQISTSRDAHGGVEEKLMGQAHPSVAAARAVPARPTASQVSRAAALSAAAASAQYAQALAEYARQVQHVSVPSEAVQHVSKTSVLSDAVQLVSKASVSSEAVQPMRTTSVPFEAVQHVDQTYVLSAASHDVSKTSVPFDIVQDVSKAFVPSEAVRTRHHDSSDCCSGSIESESTQLGAPLPILVQNDEGSENVVEVRKSASATASATDPATTSAIPVADATDYADWVDRVKKRNTCGNDNDSSIQQPMKQVLDAHTNPRESLQANNQAACSSSETSRCVPDRRHGHGDRPDVGPMQTCEHLPSAVMASGLLTVCSMPSTDMSPGKRDRHKQKGRMKKFFGKLFDWGKDLLPTKSSRQQAPTCESAAVLPLHDGCGPLLHGIVTQQHQQQNQQQHLHLAIATEAVMGYTQPQGKHDQELVGVGPGRAQLAIEDVYDPAAGVQGSQGSNTCINPTSFPQLPPRTCRTQPGSMVARQRSSQRAAQAEAALPTWSSSFVAGLHKQLPAVQAASLAVQALIITSHIGPAVSHMPDAYQSTLSQVDVPAVTVTSAEESVGLEQPATPGSPGLQKSARQEEERANRACPFKALPVGSGYSLEVLTAPPLQHADIIGDQMKAGAKCVPRPPSVPGCGCLEVADAEHAESDRSECQPHLTAARTGSVRVQSSADTCPHVLDVKCTGLDFQTCNQQDLRVSTSIRRERGDVRGSVDNIHISEMRIPIQKPALGMERSSLRRTLSTGGMPLPNIPGCGRLPTTAQHTMNRVDSGSKSSMQDSQIESKDGTAQEIQGRGSTVECRTAPGEQGVTCVDAVVGKAHAAASVRTSIKPVDGGEPAHIPACRTLDIRDYMDCKRKPKTVPVPRNIPGCGHIVTERNLVTARSGDSQQDPSPRARASSQTLVERVRKAMSGIVLANESAGSNMHQQVPRAPMKGRHIEPSVDPDNDVLGPTNNISQNKAHSEGDHQSFRKTVNMIAAELDEAVGEARPGQVDDTVESASATILDWLRAPDEKHQPNRPVLHVVDQNASVIGKLSLSTRNHCEKQKQQADKGIHGSKGRAVPSVLETLTAMDQCIEQAVGSTSSSHYHGVKFEQCSSNVPVPNQTPSESQTLQHGASTHTEGDDGDSRDYEDMVREPEDVAAPLRRMKPHDHRTRRSSTEEIEAEKDEYADVSGSPDVKQKRQGNVHKQVVQPASKITPLHPTVAKFPHWLDQRVVQLRLQLRESVPHDHDRLFQGWGSWMEVTLSKLRSLRYMLPRLPGLYEWAVLQPGASPQNTSPIAFYLGKAGRLAGGNEGLRTRLNQYLPSTGIWFGPRKEKDKYMLWKEFQKRGFTLMYRWRVCEDAEPVVLETLMLRCMDYAANLHHNGCRRQLMLPEGKSLAEYPVVIRE